MFKAVVLSCLALGASAQFQNSKSAKILKEQRFNAGDGRFGSAYAQEDGTISREEVTAAEMFQTTTLTIIVSTVFVQGGTIRRVAPCWLMLSQCYQVSRQSVRNREVG